MTIRDSIMVDGNYHAAELDKFDALSREWWDPAGRLKTLHVINPVRLRYVSNAVSLQNRRVLDIGCGGGLFTEAMASMHARVTGIDVSELAIRTAREHLQISGLTVDYQVSTIEQFESRGNGPFDIVTCMEMLEHVPDPLAVLATAARLLQPGGHLFLSTINRNLKAWLQTILIAEHVLGLVPAGTHTYADYIRPSETARWLRAAGLDAVDISGLRYLPGVNRAWIDDDPSVNYLIHARKPV